MCHSTWNGRNKLSAVVVAVTVNLKLRIWIRERAEVLAKANRCPERDSDSRSGVLSDAPIEWMDAQCKGCEYQYVNSVICLDFHCEFTMRQYPKGLHAVGVSLACIATGAGISLVAQVPHQCWWDMRLVTL